MNEQPAKARMGRPPKPVEEGTPVRSTYSVRLMSSARASLLEACKGSGRSISEELERRVEMSFIYDQFLGNIAGEGRAARMLRAFQRVVERVLKMSLTVPAEARGTPLQFEIRTRKEIQAAIAVVSHVFAATEERRPVDPERLGLEKLPWGEGDRGRRIAYEWLWWDAGNYSEMDTARTTAIDAYWTGNGEELGDLDMSTEEAAWRKRQGAPSEMTLEEMMTEPDGYRDRNADVDSEAPPAAPAEKPKRGRKAKTQA